MIDFAGPRPNPTVFCLQIVAIRMEGGLKLHHIVEHLVYDEGNGEVRPMSRDAVISYIDRFGRGSVISRHSRSKKVAVTVYEHERQRWLRTAPDGEFEDNLYALYHYEEPRLDAQTWHVASEHHSRDRTLEGVFDLIVRSDRSGEARLIGRTALAELVATAPDQYLVDTPRVRDRMLVAGQAAGKPIVSVSGSDIDGANAIFSLPQHSFNLVQL